MQKNTSKFNRITKMITVSVLSTVFCFVLAGCGSKKQDTSSIAIDKEGAITYTICEDFDGNNYDVEEFREKALENINDYNQDSLGDRVFLESVKFDQDTMKITVVLKYTTSSDFEHHNKVKFFYGTVEEARDAGYELMANLVDPDGKAPKEELYEQYKDKHVVITDCRDDILTPAKIDYVSKGVVLDGKKKAALSKSNNEYVQIVLSK
ncbi:MAG: hypothetical protein J5802_01235 [Butyrivibrio sp.]|nr:hypothetical protein [Butyrivibrio sp.]